MQRNIAKSLNKDAKLAAKEIREQFSTLDNICCITFSASYYYNADEVASAMAEQFPDVECFGAASGRQISTQCILDGALVAFAFTSDIVEDFHIEVIEHLSSGANIQPALQRLAEHYKSPLFKLEPSKHFGLVFMDYDSKAEEMLFDELGDSTQVVFMGATASDYWQFKDTGIYAKGKYYRDAAVLSLFKSKVKFGFDKMEAVNEVGSPKTVTKSDMSNKILYEIDGRPAAEVYCEVNGLDYNTIEKDNIIKDVLARPLGINIEGQRFLRDVMQINSQDKSLVMVCNIPEGLPVHFYKVDDLVKNTQEQIANLQKKYNNRISCLLTFTCINRYNDISSIIQGEEEYTKIFGNMPRTGFCTYGEYYTVPVNHTSTFLVLTKDKI